MSASTFFNTALIQFLSEQDGTKTISDLVKILESEIRSPVTKDPLDAKKAKKAEKTDNVKKVKKKRVKSAFQHFMGDHRPALKTMIAKFMEENPTAHPSVVVALLAEASAGESLLDTEPLVATAKTRLDDLKSDGFEDYCTSNELDSSDFEGSFKGRLVMTMVTRLGGKVWHDVEDKSKWEEKTEAAKEARDAAEKDTKDANGAVSSESESEE